MTDAERETWAGVARSAVNTMPSHFLALLLINCVFIGMLLWHETKQQSIRADLVAKIIEVCALKGSMQ